MATMIRSIFSFFVLLAALGLSACTPTIANRGNIVDDEKLALVQEGTSSREDVVRLLGSPTQVGTFNEKVWYYYGRQTKQVAFLDPKVIKEKAIEIHFDDQGIVTACLKLDPADQEIDPVSRRTPTYGHETTILEQLIGNLGRPAAKAPRGESE